MVDADAEEADADSCSRKEFMCSACGLGFSTAEGASSRITHQKIVHRFKTLT